MLHYLRLYKKTDGTVSRVLLLILSYQHNHLSKTQITLRLKRSTCSISPEYQLLLDLAPNEVCRLYLLPDIRWSLTPPFHPYVRQNRARYIFCCTFCQLRALHKSLRIDAASVCCPVIIRHFFRRSPDFCLIVPSFHKGCTTRLYPICQITLCSGFRIFLFSGIFRIIIFLFAPFFL